MKTSRTHLPGWFWVVASAVCFSLMGITVKQAVSGGSINIFQLGFVRFLAALIYITVPAGLNFWSLRIHNMKYFLLRGFFGAAGNFLMFTVIMLIGLGRGTILMQLMGIFGALSALFLLREKLSLRLIAAIAAGAFGVIMCAGMRCPSSYEWLAVLGALCCGLALTFIRKLNETENLHVIFYSQSICGLILMIIPAFFVGLPCGLEVWSAGLLVTLFDVAGQYFMTHGMVRTPVAVTGALLMLSPVISLTIGLTVYRESLDTLQLIGCALILSGGLLSIRQPRKK